MPKTIRARKQEAEKELAKAAKRLQCELAKFSETVNQIEEVYKVDCDRMFDSIRLFGYSDTLEYVVGDTRSYIRLEGFCKGCGK